MLTLGCSNFKSGIAFLTSLTDITTLNKDQWRAR